MTTHQVDTSTGPTSDSLDPFAQQLKDTTSWCDTISRLANKYPHSITAIKARLEEAKVSGKSRTTAIKAASAVGTAVAAGAWYAYYGFDTLNSLASAVAGGTFGYNLGEHIGKEEEMFFEDPSTLLPTAEGIMSKAKENPSSMTDEDIKDWATINMLLIHTMGELLRYERESGKGGDKSTA